MFSRIGHEIEKLLLTFMGPADRGHESATTAAKRAYAAKSDSDK